MWGVGVRSIVISSCFVKDMGIFHKKSVEFSRILYYTYKTPQMQADSAHSYSGFHPEINSSVNWNLNKWKDERGKCKVKEFPSEIY
jgi:hypothetical protein